MQEHETSPSFNLKKEKLSDPPLTLSLTPSGHLYLDSDSEASETVSPATLEKIHSFFSISEMVGLLRLGLTQFEHTLPPSFSFWQRFSQLFITELCKQVNSDEKVVTPHIAFPQEEIKHLINQAPFIRDLHSTQHGIR